MLAGRRRPRDPPSSSAGVLRPTVADAATEPAPSHGYPMPTGAPPAGQPDSEAEAATGVDIAWSVVAQAPARKTPD